MVESCDIYARALLGKLKYKDFPIRPREIARMMGIPIQEVPASGSFDGYLLRLGDSFGIMVNASINSEARKNFTIAHELGHYEIPHHKGREFKCLSSNIGIILGKDLEIEANDFAAELLMPASFVSGEIKKTEPGLGVIKAISERCETSLMSSAFRYMKYCPEIALLVISENNKIKYFILSEDARERKLFLTNGTPLSRLSLAYDCFDKNGAVTNSNELSDRVDLAAWFPTFDYSQYDCFENVVAMPVLNQVLSLIYLVEKYDANAEDDYI